MSKDKTKEKTAGKQRKGERTASKGKLPETFRWWGDWSFVWIFGGFGLIYLIFVPLKAHSLHWLYSSLGGVAGYGLGLLFDTGLPAKALRLVRRSSTMMTLKSDREKQAKGKNR